MEVEVEVERKSNHTKRWNRENALLITENKPLRKSDSFHKQKQRNKQTYKPSRAKKTLKKKLKARSVEDDERMSLFTLDSDLLTKQNGKMSKTRKFESTSKYYGNMVFKHTKLQNPKSRTSTFPPLLIY